jgi:hypothetical protein
MALRIDQEGIARGEVGNTTRGATVVRLEFADGFAANVSLAGNAWRDVAGRVLRFSNPKADPGHRHHPALVANDQGIAGDITAARKVKVLQVPLEEAMQLGRDGQTAPHVWKNSLYLEWFTLNGGRLVLEATDFEMTSGEPEWIMSDAEEKETHARAREALENFMDQLVNLNEAHRKMEKLSEGEDQLDEFKWEKFMRHSEEITDRYMELLDKYGDDGEKVDAMMGWNKAATGAGHEFPVEETCLDDPGLVDDWEEREKHPLRDMAADLLDQMGDRKDSLDNPEGDLWFAVANIGAKLAAALSGHRGDGTFDDKGFAIAALKRVLALVNEATPLMQKINPAQLPGLMKLRQEIIDLQQALRKRA